MISPVTRRAEFEALRSHGRKVRCGAMRLSFSPSIRTTTPASSYQLAFAINRKFGSAVERNRARRRLRAGFSHLVETQEPASISSGMYLIIPTRRVLAMPFDELLSDLSDCVERLSLDN